MAVFTQIDNSELWFQVKLYTGSGANQSITLDGSEDMQPDLVWLKTRNNTNNQVWTDSVRGVEKVILSNAVNAEATYTDGLTAFNSDGFSLGDDDDGQMNVNTAPHVAWCWKAGTAFSNDASATSVGNTDSNGSASSTAGFSIAKWVGAGSSTDIEVKHGLSVKPAVMLVKNIEEAGGNHWAVYHHKNTSAPETDYLKLSDDAATTDDAEIWHDTEPTSAIFTAGDHSGSNRANDDYVGYFWNEVQGFSKFGSYTGNGNADGVFVYLGFKPALIIIKRTNSSSAWWVLKDNKRSHQNGENVNKYIIYPNDSSAEGTDSNHMDLLSNGFKYRDSASAGNSSGNPFIYMAWAEAPFVNSKGVPCNAK